MPTTELSAAYARVCDLYQAGHYRAALESTEVVLRQAPGDIHFIGMRINCLLRLFRKAEAFRATRRALRVVGKAEHRTMLVAQFIEASSGLVRFDEALEIARGELDARPEDRSLRAAVARLLTLMGRQGEAADLTRALVEAGDGSLEVAAAFGEAVLRTDEAERAAGHLASLLGDAAGEGLRDGVAAGPREAVRSSAWTQLGHLLDRLKRYDDAFAAYSAANRLSPAKYDDRATAARRAYLERAYTPERFAGAPRGPLPDSGPRPVFIVGMPRSGTTLTEQIIASHPRAFGAGELSFVNELVRDLMLKAGHEEGLFPDRVDAKRLDEAAAFYRSEIARLAAPGTPLVVTDKFPHNFWYVGFLAQAFPDARVIHCRRDPRDTCLSCFFQALNAAHAYSFDLADCGRYYRHYRAMMAHYRGLASDASVGLRLLEIDYEDTVADQETQTRRILDFVGLEFDPACLKFNEHSRVAHTLSYDQVRQPIYRSSSRRFERYERHLGPLVEALGDVLEEGARA
jgi:tetratricopeptide (TPR) repeat protein